jgi:acyl carrier protein
MDDAFRTGVAEALQMSPDAVTSDTPLHDNWDSVAIMTTISLVDHLYGVTVSGGELELRCNTVGDIWRLVEASRS